jgi:HK97 family phage major capsid protein
MSKKLRELQARKSVLVTDKAESLKQAGALLDQAAAEARDLSAEEQATFDTFRAEATARASDVERLQAQIDIEHELIAAQAQMGVQEAVGIVVTENVETDPKRGFNTVGEFMQAVYRAEKFGQSPDPRLLIGAALPSSYSNEGAGQDGGFVVPPQFSKDIFTLSLGEDSLLPLTDEVEINGNSMAFPKDETTPWGTNGIRAFWQGEASTAVATKLALGLATLRLKKLMALVPTTDELLEDANALASYLPGKIADSIRWKTNEAILFGAGNGVPAGCISSPAVVTVAKESGQATATLLPANLAKMVARLPAGSYGKAIWIINNDVLPALFTLTLGNYPIYLTGGSNVGGIQVNPYGLLLGRPIVLSQHAASFSGQGDVILADLSYYQTITKAGGMQTATSMHLYFDADLTAFRTTFRMDGQPKIAQPISPAKGSNTLSPFIQLGAR